MEFEFSFRRLLLLVACLSIFGIQGGFTPPRMPDNGLHGAPQVQKAWLYCVLLFVVGAVAVSVVDHTIGHMDPLNLRPAYILIGIALMIASMLWLQSVKDALGPPYRQTSTLQSPPLLPG